MHVNEKWWSDLFPPSIVQGDQSNIIVSSLYDSLYQVLFLVPKKGDKCAAKMGPNSKLSETGGFADVI